MARLIGALGLLLLLISPAPAEAATDQLTGQLEQQLADAYAPVVVVRELPSKCSEDGEPYFPMTVDALLDNPEVALRQVGNGDAVIEWGPSASDLYGLGAGTYLDLPGDALAPGCTYAEYSRRYTPASESAVYAHVATQADRPGFLAVQYWLYSYYNDWNDRHESDWEFVQVLFAAETVEEALAEEPLSVGYAQHVGGETAAWNSDRLEKEGTHPVVYTSERSHASYLSSALYLGRGASEGFGCDDTQAPSTRLTPRAVLLPDEPTGPDDEFAWLAYDGRWGERHAGPNNGPDGPMSKPRWTKPVTWQEGLRDSSFEIPGGSEAPPAVVGTFCSVVGQGSQLYLRWAANPWAVLVVLVALAAGVVFALGRTSWTSVATRPLVLRRRAGQILRAGTNLWRRHPLPFLVVGLLALPVGALSSLLAYLVETLPFSGEAIEVATNHDDAGTKLLISTGVGAVLWPLTVFLMSAAVAHLLADDGPPTTARAVASLRAVVARGGDLASSFLPVMVATWLLTSTVVATPAAIFLPVRYQFTSQVVMLEGTRGMSALRRAGSLVRGRWWHTAAFGFLLWTGVHALGLLLGLVLLVSFTGLPLWAVSLAVLAVEVALAPLGALCLTLLYGDAVAEAADGVPVAPELAVR